MILADRIRLHAYEKCVIPARDRGRQELEIRAGDVHSDMRLHNRLPAVCAALGSNKFANMAGLTSLGSTGPANGANAIFKFRL